MRKSLYVVGAFFYWFLVLSPSLKERAREKIY